ncbi:MAG: hypothetical protein R3E10_10150 [Gemmatimonadota bacterium]
MNPSDQAALALLFPPDGPALSQEDRLGILRTLAVTTNAAGSALVDATCGQPLDHQVRTEDLNGDGAPEIVVDFGNTCVSGMAGTSVLVFVRDASGVLRPNLGLPGLIAEVLPTRSHGFADLLIGGPGFCFGVWRWDGATYAHDHNEPQAPGGCDGVGGGS